MPSLLSLLADTARFSGTPHPSDDDTLPLVPDNGDWWCIALYSCYIVTLCLVMYQIFLIVHYRHWGLQLGMLGSCALWLPLRIIFFMKLTFVMHDWPLLLMLLLLNLPTCLLVTTFSILAIIFYGQILNWREWHLLSTHSCSATCLQLPLAKECSTLLQTDCCRREVSISLKKQYWYYWGAGNLVVWMLSIYGAYDSSREMDSSPSSRANEDFRVGSIAAIYLVLAGILAYHGFKFNQLSTQEYSQSLLPRSPLAFAIMNTILCLSFTSRAAFEFIQISGERRHIDVRIATITLSGAHDKMYFGVFFLHFWWEILPTLVVIAILWKIPTHHARRYKFRQPAPSPASSSPASDYSSSAAVARALAGQQRVGGAGGTPVMGRHNKGRTGSGPLPGIDSASLLQRHEESTDGGGMVWQKSANQGRNRVGPSGPKGGPKAQTGFGIGDAMIDDRILDPFKRSDSRDILRRRQIDECKFEGATAAGSWSIFDDPRRYDSPGEYDASPYLSMDDSNGGNGNIAQPQHRQESQQESAAGRQKSPRDDSRHLLHSAPSAIVRGGLDDALDSSTGSGGDSKRNRAGSEKGAGEGRGSSSGSSSGSGGGSGGGSGSARTQGILNPTRVPPVDELTQYVSPRDVLQGLKDEYGGQSELASRCESVLVSCSPLSR
jgi:uncharacterized membrane protein YgcG